MPTRAKPKTTTKRAKTKGAKDASSDSVRVSSTVYKDFARWSSRKRPKWHPVKKMRYVFFRMIAGKTVTDALREIRWSASEFWHLVDLERNAPFREEYKRAKILQGRAFADSVLTIAEGRDLISRKSAKRLRRIIAKGMKRAGGRKSAIEAKAVIEMLLSRINENESGIISRNKLQIDGAKWMAKSANPTEFSEKGSLSIGGPRGGEPIGGEGEQQPVFIQFIGPDGKVVSPWSSHD